MWDSYIGKKQMLKTIRNKSIKAINFYLLIFIIFSFSLPVYAKFGDALCETLYNKKTQWEHCFSKADAYINNCQKRIGITPKCAKEAQQRGGIEYASAGCVNPKCSTSWNKMYDHCQELGKQYHKRIKKLGFSMATFPHFCDGSKRRIK